MNPDVARHIEVGARIGRGQAFGVIANQSLAAQAVCLRQIRDEEEFKLLTGRLGRMRTLRQADGIAPFLDPAESPHDALAGVLPLLEDAQLRAHADGWVIAALACRQLGQHADVARFVERADHALASGGTIHPWRLSRLHALRAPEPRARAASRSGKKRRR